MTFKLPIDSTLKTSSKQFSRVSIDLKYLQLFSILF